MEHRMGSRKSLMPSTEQCLVEIYLADKQIAMCPVSNIGVAGLGIERCPESLRSGMFLKIIVKTPDSVEQLYSDMNALVIWADGKQAGLMWAGQRDQSHIEQVIQAA
jgi:hypothetical protein